MAKSSDWRPGPTVCRCCLSEGCYKDISTEYFWMGKREVYAEMLTDTFEVGISFSKSSGPNSNSRLICEPCISRLRDASEFKRQVLECEKTFMQCLDPGSTSAIVEALEQQEAKDVKLETIKEEKLGSDDDDDDFMASFLDDDDDDLDDEPLMKFATKRPKKESVDILDLLDNAKATEKRKSSQTKSKSSGAPPTKKLKLVKKSELAKVLTSKSAKVVGKATSKVPKPVEKKKKEDDHGDVSRKNAKLLVAFVTAYPFKVTEFTMMCCYCMEKYEVPEDFRNHMEQEHKTFKVHMAFYNVNGYLKADCTHLRCRRCNETLTDLTEAAVHIRDTHKAKIDLNSGLGIQPFSLESDNFFCPICNIKFPQIRAISKHMNSHFGVGACEICGKILASKLTLKRHLRTHDEKSYSCNRCSKSFRTPKERLQHLLESIACCSHTCNICFKRFPSWNMKIEHKAEVHGVKEAYPCDVCGRSFNTRGKLKSHTAFFHSAFDGGCKVCGRKFSSPSELRKHRVIHTGEKNFFCQHCPKTFSSKRNLVQHSWLHNPIKRFSCKQCDKQFNQRVSWNMHMKNYHQAYDVTSRSNAFKQTN